MGMKQWVIVFILSMLCCYWWGQSNFEKEISFRIKSKALMIRLSHKPIGGHIYLEMQQWDNNGYYVLYGYLAEI